MKRRRRWRPGFRGPRWHRWPGTLALRDAALKAFVLGLIRSAPSRSPIAARFKLIISWVMARSLRPRPPRRPARWLSSPRISRHSATPIRSTGAAWSGRPSTWRNVVSPPEEADSRSSGCQAQLLPRRRRHRGRGGRVAGSATARSLSPGGSGRRRRRGAELRTLGVELDDIDMIVARRLVPLIERRHVHHRGPGGLGTGEVGSVPDQRRGRGIHRETCRFSRDVQLDGTGPGPEGGGNERDPAVSPFGWSSRCR